MAIKVKNIKTNQYLNLVFKSLEDFNKEFRLPKSDDNLRFHQVGEYFSLDINGPKTSEPLSSFNIDNNLPEAFKLVSSNLFETFGANATVYDVESFDILSTDDADLLSDIDRFKRLIGTKLSMSDLVFEEVELPKDADVDWHLNRFGWAKLDFFN